MAKNLPSVTSPLPRDLQQFVQRVRESLDGGGLDAAVTTRQLISSGLLSGTAGVALVPASGSVQPARTPTNLTATGALASILVSWNAASYNGHAYTEIWAHSSDTIGDAQLVGMTAGNNFSHQLGGAATRYYWVRNVKQNGQTSAYNATNGVQATTSTDPAYILSILTDEITASQLHSTLGSRVDLVDGAASLSGSVAARIAAEASARALAIAAEATARGSAISTETLARQSAITALSASISDITGAGSYAGSTTYSTNDLVVYNNNLYKAKQSTTGNLPTNTTYWELVGNYSSLGEVVVANTAALSSLDSRVTTAEGSITTNANSITSLNTEMTATENATTANANATSALDSRVTTAESGITSNASNITTLTSGLASSNTNITANAAAVTALDTRVTSAEGSITTNATNITSLNTEMTATETATTANTSAVSALDTRVTSAEGSITSNANSITSLNTSLTNSNTNISSNASALTALDTRVTSAEGSITSTASSLTQLTTTVGGNTTSISTNASSINGIEGKFTVKIDTAGHVSGYGLISTANDGTPTSEFGVRADTFWVSPPSNASASAPTSGLYKGYVWYDSSNNVTKYYTGSAFSTTPQTVPFVIKSTSGTVNGVTVPAGVYMDTAMIADATISNAQIGSLTADKITTSLLSTVDFYGNKIAGSTIYLGGTVNYTTSGGSNVGISSVSSPNVVLDTNGATFNVDAFRVNNLNSGAYETPFQVVNNHVYIKGANIEDASITNAKIGDVIQSDNYNAGSAGWKINKAGEMEMNNATFRGTLDVANASSGQRLAIDGDSIKVFDANNTLRVQIGDLS